MIRGEVRKSLIRDLIPLAFIVTPNIPEAETLAEMEITSVDNMKKSAKRIYSMGTKNVIVKGGHLTGDAVDVLYDGTTFHTFY